MVTQREQWREIPGTNGTYEVSDRGNVRSWSHMKQGAKLQPVPGGPRKYLCVRIPVNGKYKRVFVHREVALAFLGPRPEGALIRHLNGNKLDNRLTNLAYGTQADTRRDKYKAEALKIALAVVRAEMTGEVCPQGHERTAKNAYWHEGEYRCRTCVLEKLARFRREKPTTPLEELARPAALV